MKFFYFIPTKLSFGFGSVEGVVAETKGLGSTKTLVVTDRVATPYGLGSSVWTKNVERVYHATERIQAGTT